MCASGFVAHNVDIGPDEDGDIGRGTHWPRPQWVHWPRPQWVAKVQMVAEMAEIIGV